LLLAAAIDKKANNTEASVPNTNNQNDKHGFHFSLPNRHQSLETNRDEFQFSLPKRNQTFTLFHSRVQTDRDGKEKKTFPDPCLVAQIIYPIFNPPCLSCLQGKNA
jgi:hypothetical protein